MVRYPEAFVARIRELAVNHYDDEIVALLRAKGQMSSTGRPHSLETIKWIRYKHRIPAPRPPEGLTVRQVSKRYAVSPSVVYYWVSRGVVTARRRRPNTPYAITIDDESDRRLRDWVANSVRLIPSSRTQTA